MNMNLTFEEKFNALGEYYNIETPEEISQMIKNNENLFILLDEIKPYLEESFDDARYNLRFNFEPEYDFQIIILRLDVSQERFHNGIGDEIRSLEFKIWDLEKRLNLLRELLIMPGLLNV